MKRVEEKAKRVIMIGNILEGLSFPEGFEVLKRAYNMWEDRQIIMGKKG